MFESKTVLQNMVNAATDTLNEQAKRKSAEAYWKGFWKGAKVTIFLTIAIVVIALYNGVEIAIKLP